VEFIEAYKQMVTAHGWNGTAGHLGMSKSALEARVYEKKGQGMAVDTAMLIQDFSETKLFAQAVAIQSGGVFVQIPHAHAVDNESLLTKFNELHTDIGELSRQFTAATAGGEVSKHDRAKLEAIGDHIHEHMQELLALTFKVFCHPSTRAAR